VNLSDPAADFSGGISFRRFQENTVKNTLDPRQKTRWGMRAA
jgi:hypothetical protein